MKKILGFLMILTLLLPMAVVACHCCPNMSAPDPSSAVTLSGMNSMPCCFMLTLVKECAPKTEKFLQVSHSFINHFLSSAQNELISAFLLPSIERENTSRGAPDFLSAQPPRYLSLSVFRI